MTVTESKTGTDGRAVLHREGAEAAKLDTVAARQRIGDLVEDGVDDVLDVALVEVGVGFCDFLDEFGFDHRSAPSAGS